MKLSHRYIVTTFIVALAFPAVTFAAKGERKKVGAEALPAFATVDKDANEAISESEFAAANEKLKSKAAKMRFDRLDKDRDGKLTKAEYALVATPENKQRRKEKPGNEEIPAFATVDKDSDKSLTETEFVSANEKLGSVAAKARFELLDKDRDGKLSAEEYAAGSTPEKTKRKKKE